MPSKKFPARFEFLDEIREFVGKRARASGFSDKDIYSIQLAADEAASNVIEHAYAGMQNGTIQLSCDFNEKILTITLLDHGKQFDPAQVKDPDLNANLSDRQIGGLGIYLMRKMMDDVQYQSSKSGNLLIMRKYKK